MTSLRGAVNGKCRGCIYDPLSGGGTWREQVAQCSVITCELWPVRRFEQHVLVGRVRTVRMGGDQKRIPESLQYSVTDELVRIEQ
jgi:hypothetical protein